MARMISLLPSIEPAWNDQSEIMGRSGTNGEDNDIRLNYPEAVDARESFHGFKPASRKHLKSEESHVGLTASQRDSRRVIFSKVLQGESR